MIVAQARVEETAFAMLHLTTEQRHQAFVDAFKVAIGKRPDLADATELVMVDFTARVYQRIAELQRLQGGSA